MEAQSLAGVKVVYHDTIASVVRHGRKNSRIEIAGERVLVPTDALEILPKEFQWVTEFDQLERKKISVTRSGVVGGIWRPDSKNCLRLLLRKGDYSPGHVRLPSLQTGKAYHAIRVGKPGSGSPTQEQDFNNLKSAQSWVEEAVVWTKEALELMENE